MTTRVESFDLYGLPVGSLEDFARQIGAALEVRFILHESGYHNGEYFRAEVKGHEHFIIQNNRNPATGELAEEAFPDVSILLYANHTERHQWIASALAKVSPQPRLLRHQVV